MNRVVAAFVLLVLCIDCNGQLPYSQRRYAVAKYVDIVVGTAVNYCGKTDTIKVNIYKPIGDSNLKRPVAIFLHGGGFTSTDDANDADMSFFAEEFARRGYVGVSADYREGFHLYPFAPGLPGPSSNEPAVVDFYNSFDGGFFAADSAELVRAAYRAQQDVKGIIRWMKGRNIEDSSSTCRYFIGGHSAGAVTALATVLLDTPEEKPLTAGVLPDAVNPNWQDTLLQLNGPANKDDEDYREHNPLPFNYDNPACYQRPDLGDINGSISIGNGFDEKVMGVMSLSGGIADTSSFDVNSSTPAIYIYHVPADDMVPFESGKPLQRIGNTFNVSPATFAPVVYGGNWIWNKLDRIGYNQFRRKLFYEDTLTSSPHSILPNLQVVCDSVANFFAEVIDSMGNCTPEYTDAFVFTGNGNWNVAANWKNNSIPPSVVLQGTQVLVKPQQGGACILNVPVTVSPGAALFLAQGARFRINGNLLVQ